MNFIQYCKTIDWQKVIDVCQSLDDLNDSQYRFVKGRTIELLIEELSNGVLQFVGERHKDFDCKKYKCTIELKSLVSQNLYNKKTMRPNFTLKFNNSNGTNKVDLNPDHVTDYLLAVLKNGVVLVEKKVILENLTHQGDGWDLKLQPNKVIEISGRINPNAKYSINMKEKIDTVIKNTIRNLDNFEIK